MTSSTAARAAQASRSWTPGCWCSRAGALVLLLLTMPTLAQASPPKDQAKDPDAFADLPEVDDEPLDDREHEPAPSSSPPASEPPANTDANTDGANADADADSDAGTSAEQPAKEAPAPKVEVKTLRKAKWIKHEVVPGERLDDIAQRYKVRRESLIRWNKLDPDKPKIYSGRELAVYTKFIPPPQQKLVYTVRYGDTWPKIAATYNVDVDDLRVRWNPKVPRKFKAGQEIVIWRDPLEDPSALDEPDEDRASTHASAGTSAASETASASAAAKPAAKIAYTNVKSGSISVGKPNRGKLINALALPENKSLYTIRKPDESYGSSHTLHNLQFAIANFRQATGYAGEVVIGAISKQGGGRLRPHSSHQSGRDVDIRLPLNKPGGSSDNVDDVDWDAAWGLIQAIVATGEVQYIFLSTSRQKHLYKAAKRAGASKDLLERLIQYPNKSGTNNGIVRDEDGHTAHFHVRFTCAANETRCESY